MTLDELRGIAASVGKRRGWDFSQVRVDRDPVPWKYVDVVRRYLESCSRVLDIGTGGGEEFLSLAPYFGFGTGIDSDPAMIQVAKENTPPSLIERVSFKVMQAEALGFPDNFFDVVLNRHTPVFPGEIIRVLRPDGVLITQQVGSNNTKNICSVFRCGPGGEYKQDPTQDIQRLVDAFVKAGCEIIDRESYDVRCWFCDVESFVFWLKAVPIPEDFDIERHWQEVDRIITEYSTPKGIETNEHRELLIVRKHA
jgi:SAM-dependent methyltransferase